MACGESIGHMIDDVTRPWKIKVVTPRSLGPLSRKRLEMQTRLQQSTYLIWGSNGHTGDRDIGMFGLGAK